MPSSAVEQTATTANVHRLLWLDYNLRMTTRKKLKKDVLWIIKAIKQLSVGINENENEAITAYEAVKNSTNYVRLTENQIVVIWNVSKKYGRPLMRRLV